MSIFSAQIQANKFTVLWKEKKKKKYHHYFVAWEILLDETLNEYLKQETWNIPDNRTLVKIAISHSAYLCLEGFNS